MRRAAVAAAGLLVARATPQRVERVTRPDTVYAIDPRGVDYTSEPIAVVQPGDSVIVPREEAGKAYLYWRVGLAPGREGVMIWNPDTFAREGAPR